MPTNTEMASRTRARVLLTAGLAAAFTLLVSVLPFINYAYRSRQMHVAIEMAAGVVAGLTAYLILGRFRRSCSRADLLIAGGLAILALNSVVYGVGPLIADGTEGTFDAWSPVFGSLLGAIGLALAAVLPDRRVRHPRHAAVLTLGLCVVLTAACGLVVALLAPRLALPIDPDVSPDATDRPRIVGAEGALAVQMISTVLFAAAAVGFSRRAERTGDELLSWLAIAATVAAFARLNYFLFPSVFTDWVYTGDALRLVFFVLLMVGAVREISLYQRQLGEAATLEERRRIARDLHDGLAQELAYISSQARGLKQEPVSARLVAAADRALDESRSAIAALTGPLDESLESAVARAAEDVADRHGAEVRLDLAEGIDASLETRDAFVRIVREGITNAIRHGSATRLAVRLENSRGLRLEIEDNGSGFDVAGSAGGSGFGLVSMRERARAIGGDLRIESVTGRGTTIEVVIP